MISYRLCEEKDGKPYTLFHAYDGSREITLGVWERADTRIVSDGGREYKGGFHTIPYIDVLRNYALRFRKQRTLVIVKCHIPDKDGECWTKPTNSDILLAGYMMIRTQDWANREEVVI